jgi:hypothetical protein
MSDTIILNEKQITLQEFEDKKNEIKNQKGIELVKLQENVYKTRLLD